MKFPLLLYLLLYNCIAKSYNSFAETYARTTGKYYWIQRTTTTTKVYLLYGFYKIK